MAVSAEKPLWGSVTAITCTLTSTLTAHCRTGTEVDNTTNRYRAVTVSLHTKVQSTPTIELVMEVWGLRSNADSTAIKDGSYTDDADFTYNLRPGGGVLLGVIRCDGSATPVLQGNFRFPNPGRKWNILIINQTGQTLSATGSDHVLSYYGENPEAQ